MHITQHEATGTTADLETLIQRVVSKTLEHVQAGHASAPESSRILTFREARIELRCSAPTLRKILRSGKLPAVRIGAQWRVREQDLLNFMQGAQ